MWALLGNLKAVVNVKRKESNIDNWVFKLHYRFTFWFLLISSGYFWSVQWVMKNIQCSHSRQEDAARSNEKLDKFKDKWCYFMGVHTIPRHYEKNAFNSEVPYAGVGPVTPTDEPRELGWYQWVYYVLLLQALMFYLPRVIWRIQEKKIVHNFVQGMGIIDILNENTKNKLLAQVRSKFKSRVSLNSSWANWLLICEFLNLCNVICQWFITDRFLDGNFSKLGYAVFEEYEDHQFSRLDVCFPKMAKCTYLKFGPTGEIQNEDLICVMSYNIMYEKVYLILWYWYIFLMIFSAGAVSSRIISWVTYNCVQPYFITTYRAGKSYHVTNDIMEPFMKSHSYKEWLFVSYLISNLDDKMGAKLLKSLVQEQGSEPEKVKQSVEV